MIDFLVKNRVLVKGEIILNLILEVRDFEEK
jgi:hypothetical protein